ncbi:MAG TPA: valine--tRNA ligase [Thermomicrobiales bacterium]|nr:valine--tRNA ligase [Thermomicrobiales bacterium]
MTETIAPPTTPPESAQGGLAKAYDPRLVEAGVYDRWDGAGAFRPQGDPDRSPFVVVMPPPNVTGELHIGHALFVAVEDIMVRWHRMLGDPTLWTPGADHAGIAGQWVVEKLLREEGLTRHDLGREKFVERVWDYMNRYRGRIREQMEILGASCDWSRFVFTMDPGPSRAVRHAFKRLYDKGLVYKGERLISWCPRCMTALSDLEVVHRDDPGSLWTLRYPVEGSDEAITVATTRPETMLGDTGVAVHPDDERYRHLVGRMVRLPIVDRPIPVVADEGVDPAFGSGAVKVTPNHDPNDFEIARRQGLPGISIMNPDGTLTGEAGPFAGLTGADARQAVVARLEADGALLKTEPHRHAVGHCQRCDTVVEPLISEQWFVRMAPLAAPAIEAAKDGSLRFVPDHFKSVYLNWRENIHDWTVSRQLWWGHRIPVWYCQGCGETVVTEEETLAACPACGGAVEQDPDVLDTWFSSGLWPFSTLGWPDETPDLNRFYPSSVMETGYEILFFWVARMVFFGLEFTGELPFHTVYLHGTVRDAEGAKMSKTKGNVIDPTLVTAEYGADALRFALVTQSSPGNDLKLDLQKVEDARNFANKLWNATRFALRPIAEQTVALDTNGPLRPSGALALADRWILSRLDATTADATRLMEQHLYGEAGKAVREFVWSELCDWYLEAAKVRLRGTPGEQAAVAQTLAFVLERSLRLLHPYMPFLTETLWTELPHAGDLLISARWPAPAPRDEEAETAFAGLIDLVRAVRNARTEANVEPGRWIAAEVYAGPYAAAFADARRELAALARIDGDQLAISDGEPAAAGGALTAVAGETVALLPLAGMVDLGAERERLEKELGETRQELGRADKQLSNESFVSRAPAQVVEVQRRRRDTALEQIALLERRLGELG